PALLEVRNDRLRRQTFGDLLLRDRSGEADLDARIVRTDAVALRLETGHGEAGEGVELHAIGLGQRHVPAGAGEPLAAELVIPPLEELPLDGDGDGLRRLAPRAQAGRLARLGVLDEAARDHVRGRDLLVERDNE